MAITTRDNFLNIYQRPFISVNSSHNIQTQACSFANRDNLKCTITRGRKKSRITSQNQVIKTEAISYLYLTGFANMYYSNKQTYWTFNLSVQILHYSQQNQQPQALLTITKRTDTLFYKTKTSSLLHISRAHESTWVRINQEN